MIKISILKKRNEPLCRVKKKESGDGSQSEHSWLAKATAQQLLAIHFMKENHFPLKRQADLLLLETGATCSNHFKRAKTDAPFNVYWMR